MLYLKIEVQHLAKANSGREMFSDETLTMYKSIAVYCKRYKKRRSA